MYTLLDEEIREDLITQELYSLFQFYSDMAANTDNVQYYYQSMDWLCYYHSLQENLLEIANEYKFKDILDTRFYVRDIGSCGEEVFMKKIKGENK